MSYAFIFSFPKVFYVNIPNPKLADTLFVQEQKKRKTNPIFTRRLNKFFFPLLSTYFFFHSLKSFSPHKNTAQTRNSPKNNKHTHQQKTQAPLNDAAQRSNAIFFFNIYFSVNIYQCIYFLLIYGVFFLRLF